MLCDHDATKASLRVFLAATHRHALQDFDGSTVLMGVCRGCDSTLAVEVDLARGHIVRGELTNGVRLDDMSGADAAARSVPGQDVIAGATPTHVDDTGDPDAWMNDPTVQAIR